MANEPAGNSHRTLIISLVGLLFIAIAGGAYLIYADKKKKFPFNPYVRKTGPSGAGPIGPNAKPLTKDEIDKRKKILSKAKSS